MTFADMLLGGYAMAPAEPRAEAEFYAGLADLGIRGLELPLPLEGGRGLEPSWFARNVQTDWDLLVTCIPTVMGRRSSDVSYGIASADESGRLRAVDDVARARDLARTLADQHGARRVVGIQVHSAPGPEAGSSDALSRSLEQILAWDLADAELLLEHCDARKPGQSAAKGFFSLDDELAAVRSVGAGTDRLGMSINWGRSAIEGRSALTAVDHTRAAAGAGLLRALIFSGASDRESMWGAPWGDTHIPPRGDDSALEASSSSLLGPPEIVAALTAAADVPRIAVKVSVRPADVDVAARLAVARAALTSITDARSSL